MCHTCWWLCWTSCPNHSFPSFSLPGIGECPHRDEVQCVRGQLSEGEAGLAVHSGHFRVVGVNLYVYTKLQAQEKHNMITCHPIHILTPHWTPNAPSTDTEPVLLHSYHHLNPPPPTHMHTYLVNSNNAIRAGRRLPDQSVGK